MNTKDFTFVQILNYQNYERIRESGEFNMFDPRAQIATGLNTKEYIFVMNNYSALREQYILED